MKPITKLVAERKSNKFPLNQEVTMNADGSGGPVSALKCWKGYKRVPGTKKGAKGSCKKK